MIFVNAVKLTDDCVFVCIHVKFLEYCFEKFCGIKINLQKSDFILYLEKDDEDSSLILYPWL